MNCTCSIEMDHDEESDMVFEKMLTVNKHPKKCCECGETLEIGDKYYKEIAIWDNESNTYRTCVDCISVRDNIFCGWNWTTLWEDLQMEIEYGNNISESCIAALTPNARIKVCEMIERYWEKKI